MDQRPRDQVHRIRQTELNSSLLSLSRVYEAWGNCTPYPGYTFCIQRGTSLPSLHFSKLLCHFNRESCERDRSAECAASGSVSQEMRSVSTKSFIHSALSGCPGESNPKTLFIPVFRSSETAPFPQTPSVQVCVSFTTLRFQLT